MYNKKKLLKKKQSEAYTTFDKSPIINFRQDPKFTFNMILLLILTTYTLTALLEIFARSLL